MLNTAMSHMSPHVWREVAMDESDMVGGSGELHGWSWGGYFGAYILTRYTERPVDSKLFRFGVCVCVFSFGESVVYIRE